MRYKIYIPTWRRIDRTPVLKLVDPETVTIVARPEEAEHYRKQGWDVMELPPFVTHIGQTRHHIITSSDVKYVWMVDDDVTNSNLHTGIEYISYYAKSMGAAVFGFGPHLYKNIRLERDGKFSYRVFLIRVWGVDRDIYLKEKLRMDEWAIWEDAYCNIALRMAGYPAIASNEFEHKSSVTLPGGCDEYRSYDLAMSHLSKLKETFPDYVELKEKPGAIRQGFQTDLVMHVAWARLERECLNERR